MIFGESAPRRVRIWEQARSSLGADTVVFGSRYGRLWEQIRMRLLPRSLTTIGKGLLGKQIVVFFLENPFMTCIYETVYFV